MDEDLLKYFTGTGTPTTQTIRPQKITNGSSTLTGDMQYAWNLLTTNDNNYIIRYGGTRGDSASDYSAIEVYDINTIL